MSRIGYHASHEQVSPRDLLDLVKLAEQAGFACTMSAPANAPSSRHSAST
jgi:coenzyme F420-dependent glucose-6-phosphate dehydrogenase